MCLLVGVCALWACLAAAAPPEPGPPPPYTVTDIALLPWVSDDVAPHINASGEISLWQETADHIIHAFVWKQGVLEDRGALPGYVSSIATQINAGRDITGWSVDGKNLVDSRATTHAFLCSRGQMRDLGTLGGGDSKAIGMNQSGAVVGWSSMPDSNRHAFLCRGGKLKDLGTLPGGAFSAAYAINEDGSVIVGAAETSQHLVHAVMWKGSVIADLGTLPGGLRSRALALNERGEIVGFSEAEGAETHAFLYADGRMQDLGSLGKDPMRANAINNHGQIVGASGVNAFVRHAFLWEGGKMQDLNKLVAPASGWRIQEATDINDAGEILCIATRAEATGKWHLLRLSR